MRRTLEIVLDMDDAAVLPDSLQRSFDAVVQREGLDGEGWYVLHFEVEVETRRFDIESVATSNKVILEEKHDGNQQLTGKRIELPVNLGIALGSYFDDELMEAIEEDVADLKNPMYRDYGKPGED